MIKIDEKEYMKLLQCQRDLETIREVMNPILESIFNFAGAITAMDKEIPDSVMVNFSFENAGALMMALSPNQSEKQ